MVVHHVDFALAMLHDISDDSGIRFVHTTTTSGWFDGSIHDGRGPDVLSQLPQHNPEELA